MSTDTVATDTQWSLTTEKFFFYYMGLRKNDLRNQVVALRARYPDESAEQLARRLMAAQLPLSLVGSALIHIPTIAPSLGPAFRFMGLASGTTVMIILNMTLAMQIALLYGFDIDDRARLKELLAIVAVTGFASSSTALVPQLADLSPALKALTGGTAVVTTSHLIGETAIRYFSKKQRKAQQH